MLSVLVYVTIAACGVLALWALVHVVRDRPVIFRQLIAGAVVEALLLVQVVVATVLSLTGHEIAEPLTFWGYLVVVLLLLPGAAVWSLAERSRWSSVVLLVAVLAVVVMELRVEQLWLATAAAA